MGFKKILIISPYFPPSNAADMQRVRMSLPYFNQMGWKAEIVTVDPIYSDFQKDKLLIQGIPRNILLHHVRAFSKKWTSRLGLGSIALRSMWFYYRKVNSLLNEQKYDLIYFSTTQFPICVLGAYWKKRFGIPFVIDMQDPWHSEYYQDKPKDQRPPKYWFSYRLNKTLEPIAMKQVSGLISVSQSYIDDLKTRYLELKDVPEAVITFGAFEKDFEVADSNAGQLNSPIKPEKGKINIVYVGRGGRDMHQSVNLLFLSLQKGLSLEPDLFRRYHFYFIGTSYATAGNGTKTIEPLADELGLSDFVTEITDRIGFYESIATLQKADVLFIPGSDDPRYTASKIYPYLISQKPLLAIFHEQSSAVQIIRFCSPGANVITFPGEQDKLINVIYEQLYSWCKGNINSLEINTSEFNKYSALAMTARQTELFDKAISLRKGPDA